MISKRLILFNDPSVLNQFKRSSLVTASIVFPFIMGRMALAAKIGGASGIRANTKEDIAEIQTQVDLPIIGIVKRDYEDSEIYITPTMKEIDELMEVKPEIIAMDATISTRPEGKTLDEFFHEEEQK